MALTWARQGQSSALARRSACGRTVDLLEVRFFGEFEVLKEGVLVGAAESSRLCWPCWRSGGAHESAGHASPQAALRYQHATAERDRGIAKPPSDLAEAMRRENEKTLADNPDAPRTAADVP